jgi:Fe2+ or Zn2+ uptake regulation protein
MEMKYSKQREMIHNCVKDNPCHLTADAIYEMLKKDHPNLSLGTVYRNLSQLAEHDMIKKVSIPGYPDRFDGTLEDHFHFICLECGEVKDLFIPELYGIDSVVEQSTGVDVSKCEMTFKGICEKCKSTKIV